MAVLKDPTFDVTAFLTTAGLKRSIRRVEPRRTFFSQGDTADSIFYLQKGRAKLSVVAQSGKVATIALVTAGEFLGEDSLGPVVGFRLSTATAMTTCLALRIERLEMLRVLHEEHSLSDVFLKSLLLRMIRTQADLIDQLFNASEKRLARLLMIMAGFDTAGEPHARIPRISQETLAEMIGTTRSRVSFFMNRFRRLGFIEYNGGIRVHKSLLNVVLYDRVTK